jgi:hypothetical protein
MQNNSVEVLDVRELGLIIKKTAGTILSDLVRNPERIPKPFKLPGSRRPLWLRSVVDRFLIEQAIQHGALEREKSVPAANLTPKANRGRK